MKYIQSLVAVGYFQGELESSENWNRRENKAAEMFVEVRREECVYFTPLFRLLTNVGYATVTRAAKRLQRR
jgi:hypothetical protein